MALGIDFVCMAFFFVLTILGPDFYQMGVYGDVDWVGWCHGLNLGMGIVVLVASSFQWKQEPKYTYAGMFCGAVSIFLSTMPFTYLK